MTNHENYGLARLTVKQIRDCGCEVVHDPKPDDYAHAIIPKTTPRSARQLAQTAELIRRPKME